MNERILNLLLLCLKAKESGEDVFFDYSPHVQSISIYSYEYGHRKIDCNFYVDGTKVEVNKAISKAERQINKAIEKRGRIS